MYDAAPAVDNGHIARLRSGQCLTHAHHGRYSETPRDDGCVRRGSAGLGYEAQHAIAVQARSVRRCQVVGDHDRLTRHLIQKVIFAMAQLGQNAAFHVLNIGLPGPEKLVFYGIELPPQLLHGAPECILGVYAFREDLVQRGLAERIVLQDQNVGIEDLGVVGAQFLLHFSADRAQVLRHVCQRLPEPTCLALRLLVRDPPVVDPGILWSMTVDGPDGDARRGWQTFDRVHRA